MTADDLAAKARSLQHITRGTMTPAELIAFRHGRALADLVSAEARKPGAPDLLLFVALSRVVGTPAALTGLAQRLQQLLAHPAGDGK